MKDILNLKVSEKHLFFSLITDLFLYIPYLIHSGWRIGPVVRELLIPAYSYKSIKVQIPLPAGKSMIDPLKKDKNRMFLSS